VDWQASRDLEYEQVHSSSVPRFVWGLSSLLQESAGWHFRQGVPTENLAVPNLLLETGFQTGHHKTKEYESPSDFSKSAQLSLHD
jgi:hypothetical protein